MGEDEIAQQSVMGLAGMVIMTAIPVVAFALWCDYFERFFRARVDEQEPVTVSEELHRVRTAGFFVTLFQVLVFFGTTPIRREHPLIGYPLFILAVFAQLAIQRGIEFKIQPDAQMNQKVGRPFWTLFWSIAAALTYVSVILFTVFVFSVIGVLIGAPIPARVCLLLCGMALGVAGGLSLSFAMGAFFVRKIMAARPIESGDLRDQVLALFDRAGVEPPELWLIDIPQFHGGTAMMAGFAGGRGIFRPGFFISSGTVKALSDDELRSVVLHEISHWSLGHLRKRFVFSTGLVLCASLVTGIAVLCARLSLFGAGEQAQSLVGCLSLVLSFSFSFRLLAHQVRYQELAADIHSIENLGSRLSDLASALRKLDRDDHRLEPIRKDFGLRPEPGEAGSMRRSLLGHPSTEYRIRVLEKYFEKKSVTQAGTSSRDAA